MVFVGLTQPGRIALCNSLVQSYTSREYLGRVMALYTVQEGVASLGGFIAAMIATVIGTPWTVGSFAICMSLFALGTLIFLPRIRRLD
jgi:MFS-type transporter involved in bile tolerance (Atg22 family)